MAGDRLIDDPVVASTRGITIRGRAGNVWPWIAQLGAGRAGWYGFDGLTNGGRPSADLVLPQFQQIRPGDLLPARVGSAEAFVVVAVHPFRTLLLGVRTVDGYRMTWELMLEPGGNRRLRLLARTRLSAAWLEELRAGTPPGAPVLADRLYRPLARLPAPACLALARLGHALVEVALLRGIRQRAERELGRTTARAGTPGLIDRLVPRAAVAELRELREPPVPRRPRAAPMATAR